MKRQRTMATAWDKPRASSARMVILAVGHQPPVGDVIAALSTPTEITHHNDRQLVLKGIMKNMTDSSIKTVLRGNCSLASLLLCATLLLTPAEAEANLLSNGSFESPVGSVGLNSGRPTGWTGFGGFANGLINLSVANYPSPQDGDQFVNIGTGSLVQPFTVAIPGDYLLKWFDNSLTTGWNGSYGVEVRDSSSSIVDFMAYSYSYSGSSPWRELSLNLPGLTAGSYTLTFGPGTSLTFMDNVSLDQIIAPPVPESGSIGAVIICTLIGLGQLTRKHGI